MITHLRSPCLLIPVRTWNLFSERKPVPFICNPLPGTGDHGGGLLTQVLTLHVIIQFLGGTRCRPEPVGLCLSSTPTVSPCQGARALGVVGPCINRERAVGNAPDDSHSHPFHPLPSRLVDSWPSRHGLGRLRTVFFRAPGSQEQELPRAIFVPGSPFRGFLGRWERLWLVDSQGRGPIVSDFWLVSEIKILQFPH